ncbi:MAG: hypothetical protein FWE13_01035 [Firmicutes bacterium]|nr:hypothetical protein [Bacillota bacterium]
MGSNYNLNNNQPKETYVLSLAPGEIAVRSSSLKFRSISNAIGILLCAIASVIFGIMQNERWEIWVAACVTLGAYSLGMCLYNLYMLSILPPLRIKQNEGNNTLTLFITKKESVTINPSDIQDVMEKPGNLFLAGRPFRDDGNINIMADGKIYNLRHIHQSKGVFNQLLSIKKVAKLPKVFDADEN